MKTIKNKFGMGSSRTGKGSRRGRGDRKTFPPRLRRIPDSFLVMRGELTFNKRGIRNRSLKNFQIFDKPFKLLMIYLVSFMVLASIASMRLLKN